MCLPWPFHGRSQASHRRDAATGAFKSPAQNEQELKEEGPDGPYGDYPCSQA